MTIKATRGLVIRNREIRIKLKPEKSISRNPISRPTRATPGRTRPTKDISRTGSNVDFHEDTREHPAGRPWSRARKRKGRTRSQEAGRGRSFAAAQ